MNDWEKLDPEPPPDGWMNSFVSEASGGWAIFLQSAQGHLYVAKERYDTEEEAIEAHLKWIRDNPDLMGTGGTMH